MAKQETRITFGCSIALREEMLKMAADTGIALSSELRKLCNKRLDEHKAEMAEKAKKQEEK